MRACQLPAPSAWRLLLPSVWDSPNRVLTLTYALTDNKTLLESPISPAPPGLDSLVFVTTVSLDLTALDPYGDQNNASPRKSIRFPNFFNQFVLFLS